MLKATSMRTQLIDLRDGTSYASGRRAQAVLLGAVVLGGFAGAAVAELQFVTVGAPGNRATLPHETPWNPGLNRGSVSYEFRITQTEVLVHQWYDFVIAYRPFWTGAPNDSRLTSYILRTADGQGYGYPAFMTNFPVFTTWEMAARYCNWLHNDKISEAWAFESGAYDTSTFTRNLDGSFNHIFERSPSAKYWIPNLEEALKSIFYDPDRHGPGQEGYWLYANKTDTPPIEASPDSGGTTNAGLGWDWLSAGQYPDQASPWGLLDTSGGEQEWTSTSLGAGYLLTTGSSAFAGLSDVYDRLDWVGLSLTPDTLGRGFRVAGIVPAPSAAALVGMWLLVRARRSR
jgi:hypothetical protein